MDNIKRLIKDTHVFQRKRDEFDALIKRNMDQIQQYFDEEKVKELLVDGETENDTALIAKKSEKVTIEYFIDKLEKKLDQEIFNEIIRKSYTVADMARLKMLMKDAGVSAKAFKECITVTRTVDRPAVRQLYDTGDIKKDDIKGCYSAKVVKSIKIIPAPKDG